MAVKILLTLEGTDAVKAQIDEVKEKGKELIESLKGAGDPKAIQDFLDSLGKIKPATEGASEATNTFSEAIHILHPILKAAGIELQNFAGFSRLASAGIAGLAAAISGTLVVAFADAEESAARARAVLSGLFGSKELGTQAFATLTQSASNLDTTVSGLAPAFQAATIAIQRFAQTGSSVKFVAPVGGVLPPGIAGNIDDTAKAIENLIKIIRAGGATQEDAEKAAEAFFTTLQNGGKITADALNKLNPQAVSLLAQALGKGRESAEQFRLEMTLQPANVIQATQALSRFTEQAQVAFDTSAVKSFKDEFQALANTLKKAFSELTGTDFSSFLIKALKTINIEIQTSVEQIKAFREFLAKPALTGFTELNNQLKEIADREKQALDNLTQLQEQAAQPPQALPFRGIGIPPGSVTAPPAEIPLPVPDPRKIQSALDATAAGLKPIEVPLIFDVPAFVQSLGQALSKAGEQGGAEFGQEFVTGFELTATQGIAQAANNIGLTAQQRISEAFAALNPAPPDFSSLTSSFQTATNSMLQQAQTIWQQITTLFSQSVSPNFTPGTAGFAGGGPVFGPGTATSDSILARLSVGEFVHPTRAVSYYGLQFMEAIRQMRFPRDLLFDLPMPRFAAGGATSSTMTSSSATPVHLHLDGTAFQLNASENVANALRKHAVKARLVSTGRKPSWY